MILVAYTTNSGSTEEVARAIADALESGGQAVQVRRLEEVDSLDAYSGVVIGGPMILGWHRTAVKFVRKHRTALQRVPVAFFATAMRLTCDGKSVPDAQATSLYLDPELAAEPSHPGRLGLKEWFTSTSHYLNPMLRAAPGVAPFSVAILGGKLEIFRLKWWQALFVMLVVRAQPGDFRNWPYIKTWSAALGSVFAEQG